jgi:hypothetical protein
MKDLRNNKDVNLLLEIILKEVKDYQKNKELYHPNKYDESDIVTVCFDTMLQHNQFLFNDLDWLTQNYKRVEEYLKNKVESLNK